MTGSTAIDVVIGLVFVFLLYSLLASILQEVTTNILGLRSKMLLKSIARMLDDGDPDLKPEKMTTLVFIRRMKIVNFVVELLKNLRSFFIWPFFNRPLTHEFYDHPSIKYLSESSWNNKPAYLRAETFAQTLIDLLKGKDDSMMSLPELIAHGLRDNGTVPPETRRHLKVLLTNAGNDIEKFKTLVEEWFNETQERASGWYKKQAQIMLFIIGLVLAYSFNVDAIAIAKLLAKNDKIRQQFVAFSLERYDDIYEKGRTATSSDSTLAAEDVRKAREEVRFAMEESNAILGLGRRDTCLQGCDDVKTEIQKVLNDSTIANELKVKKVVALAADLKTTKELSRHQGSVRLAFLGWILTAFAISLGAPFWFDLLNKVAVIRSSVKPKAPPATDNK